MYTAFEDFKAILSWSFLPTKVSPFYPPTHTHTVRSCTLLTADACVMHAITSFYRVCTLHASNSQIYMRTLIYVYMCVHMHVRIYTYIQMHISLFRMRYTVLPLFPSMLMLLMHANNWWWTNKMVSFGAWAWESQSLISTYIGCLVMQFHSGMRDSQSIQFTHTHIHQYAGDESRHVLIRLRQRLSVSLPGQQTKVISF